MEITNIRVFIGATTRLRFRLVRPEDVSDWTTQFTVTDPHTRAIIYQVAGTITNPDIVPNSDQLGIFDVPLSSAVTELWTPKNYKYAFWRTNPGFEDPLASGTLTADAIRL